MPNSEQHTSLIPLHDELLKRNAEDIKEIKNELYGIPQRMDSLEKGVTQLCDGVAENNRNVVDLLHRLEDKFQTKEMCTMCSESMDKELTDFQDATDKRIGKLEVKFDKAMIALVVGLVAMLGFLGKYGFDLLMKTILRNYTGE